MASFSDLRWAQEAHPRTDPTQVYRARMAERARSQFETADWHAQSVAVAVGLIESALDSPDSEEPDSQQIIATLRESDLIPPVEELDASPVASVRDLVFGALVGEAAAKVLLRRMEPKVWRLVDRLVFNLDGALASLIKVIKSVPSDDGSKQRFADLASAVAADDPLLVSGRFGNHGDTVAHVVEQWHKNPNLAAVWSGLPELRNIFCESKIWTLSHLYLALDPKGLAELLDRFDTPYPVWVTLTGFWSLGLDRNFQAWSAMFRHAKPSFRSDGSWTHKTLEPLLLVIAQEALRQARLQRDATDELAAERQKELDELTAAISETIAEKKNGSSLALRWSARLVQLSVGGAPSGEESYPQSLRQANTPLWSMLLAVSRSRVAESWNAISASDAPAEEELCLLSARLLASSEGRCALPDAAPLLQCLPEQPEDFLGTGYRPVRARVRMYHSYGARPDALKYRILGLVLFKDDPVAFYRDFWARSLTLRELAEHWQAGDQNDGRLEAKDTLALVLALGVTALDYYADGRTTNHLTFTRSARQFGELFQAVYDALRELQAIEIFNQPFWTQVYHHLLVRRVLYEKAEVSGFTVPAPLDPTSEPTLATMLKNIAGVSSIFFDGLQALDRNGVPLESIANALRSGHVDLQSFVAAAQHLNEIDQRAPYRIEAAERVVRLM
jgi:hypothetical protein